MRHLKIISLLAVSVILAGCIMDADPRVVDFGKVYVGRNSDTQWVRWVNDHHVTGGFLGAATASPYEVLDAKFQPQSLRPREISNPVAVRFSPTSAGSFNESLKPLSQKVPAVSVQLMGQGVWRKDEGNLRLGDLPATSELSNVPQVTYFADGKPLDFGTQPLKGAAKTMEIQVRNLSSETIWASVRLLKGDPRFSITAPSGPDRFPIQGNSAAKIVLSFVPSDEGEFMDVIEVTDRASARNRSGIVLWGKVTGAETK